MKMKNYNSIQGEKIMKNVNMNPDAKLSFLERFAYGIGDYAGNLVYSAISAFLLVYYTNVIGASAAAAASIIAISKFLDGISDLAMGYIVDHTHQDCEDDGNPSSGQCHGQKSLSEGKRNQDCTQG